FRLQNMLQALRLKLLAEAGVRRSWEQAGYTKGKVWLAEVGCLTTTEADNQLQLARQLETAGHEPINQALAAGAVPAGHARQSTQRLTTLPAEVDHATRERIRDQLLAEARWLDPKALGHRAAGILEVEAPEVAQDEEERREARFVERAERRSLEIIRNADNHGMARIRGFLPAPEADVFYEALYRIAYPPNTTVAESDLRTHEQRLCDAFCVYIAGDRSFNAEQAGEPANRPRLKITISLDQLQNGHGTGYLDESGQPLPVETVRQAACDAGVIPAVLNSAGVPLDLGREQRLVSAKL